MHGVQIASSLRNGNRVQSWHRHWLLDVSDSTRSWEFLVTNFSYHVVLRTVFVRNSRCCKQFRRCVLEDTCLRLFEISDLLFLTLNLFYCCPPRRLTLVPFSLNRLQSSGKCYKTGVVLTSGSVSKLLNQFSVPRFFS